jgi:hypothetical protein
MSFVDAKTLFSDEQDLGAGSASLSVESTNVIDTTAQVNDLGTSVSGNLGESGAILNVFVDGEAFTCSTSAGQLTVQVTTSNSLSSSALSSATVVGTATVRALTAAATGTWNVDGAALYQGSMPYGDYDRYVALNYVGTTKMTAGKVTAWLGLDGETQVSNK